jgi:hypothetical protein
MLSEKTQTRQLALIGDCTLSILSIKEAATAAGGKTTNCWPNIQPGTDSSQRNTPARVALRAAESFARMPFENFPLGNRHIYKAGQLMQTATNGTIKRICAMLM